MSTIPASEIVDLNPTVLTVGGAAVDMSGLMLTTSIRPPIGSVVRFASFEAVSAYFGAAAEETDAAEIYFGGFTGSSKLPGALLFAQYNEDAVSAYLRGGDVSDYSLSELQAISGALSITIDGSAESGTPNLSAATSFSNAAQIISIALGNLDGPEACSFTGEIATDTLTVSAVASGALAVGQFIHGVGVDAGLYITALGTGTGGTGTYTLSGSDTVSSEAMTSNTPAVTYDSVAGAFVVTSSTTGASSTVAYATGAIADDLKLQAAQGAVLSQGAIAAVPATFMDALIGIDDKWSTFMNVQDPDASGNAIKLAFAEWNAAQNNRYAYVAWDSDVTPTQTVPATSSMGYLLTDDEIAGTCINWGPDNTKAAFVCGVAASIDFELTDGRITFAFKNQAGLVADVSTKIIAQNLAGSPQGATRGNGYNFYGAYGAANADFSWYQRGFVSGDFAWFDSYINQIWLNNSLQLALLLLFESARSIPFTPAGNAKIENALADVIAAGLNFGAFAPGNISTSQAATVDAQAGRKISNTLQAQGYFLQITAASAAVRAARGPLGLKFWYLDRGSVQSITLDSIAVQ